MNAPPEAGAAAAWPAAARLVARWLDRGERVDALLDTLPRSLKGPGRARCHHLVLGVIRHYARLDTALGRLVSHPPRFSTRAVLFIAGFELLEAVGDGSQPPAEGRVEKIVHHAVGQTKALASPAEARLVNAVGRRLAAILARPAPAADAPAEELAVHFSHPAWLIRNWQAQFGPEATRALLEWNQTPATVHVRWRDIATTPPEFLKPTEWPGFFEVESGHWSDIEPLIKSRRLYVQDPSTRTPVDLLEPAANENIADLCAAPGGKSLLIADRMKTGLLVAIEAPGPRIARLKENLACAGEVRVALVQGDILADIGALLREHRLPGAYDAVLLDAPCSNTGVMRHRVDVKWRLQPGDFKKHPRQQLSMLHAAARLTAACGRLVYSTCSIDAEENEHVVRAFLAGKAGGPFTLEATMQSFPWVTRHDGGAAFRLRRRS